MASASMGAMRRLVGRNILISGGGGNALGLRLGASSVTHPRSFNTNAQMARLDDDRSHRPSVSRRRDFPPSAFFSDVFDPFSTTRSVSQLVNLMDQLMESPASRGIGIGGGGGAFRRGWDIREDEDALRLNVDMPGLGKEDVKVSVEDNTLVIKGEAAPTDGDHVGEAKAQADAEADNRRRYSSRIDLTPNTYKIDGIKAEMKNGVLKLTVPKLQEDNKDVFQVAVH